jgi:amidophosphoribosyltransferase
MPLIGYQRQTGSKAHFSASKSHPQMALGCHTKRVVDIELDDRLKEECGVLGVYTQPHEGEHQDAARIGFFGLFALQHRGQESAGIAVSDGTRVRLRRGMGLVNQVFDEAALDDLPGHIAVGHTRYSTTGASELRNAQPVFCQSQIGDIAIAHNGNLINARELRAEMEQDGDRFDSTSDSEIIARIIVKNMHLGPEAAVAEVMRRARGAYSVTVLTPKVLIGFRDPTGIRPLVVGTLGDDGYLIASETCAFHPVGGVPLQELEPGEMVIIDAHGMRLACGAKSTRKAMCLFEFIYFARPDSVMYGTSLYTAREKMGAQLAKEHPVEADIVVPVPDSGIPAALGYSVESGIPYREGMVKSRYIHRTFISPNQRMRELGVKMKLTALENHLVGKRVILVDDSIVRGTTTKQIVKLMFDSGATEVHVRITAPPIKFPCFYGIDMADKSELAAAKMTIKQLEEDLGATSLGYLSIQGAIDAVGKGKDNFCLACFNGDYPVPVPDNLRKDTLDKPTHVGEIAAISHGQLKLIEM